MHACIFLYSTVSMNILYCISMNIMCVCVVCMYVEARGQCHSPPYFWGQLFPRLGAHWQVSWPGGSSPLSLPLMLGSHVCCRIPSLFFFLDMDTGALNLSHHACVSNSLLSGPYPQCRFFEYFSTMCYVYAHITLFNSLLFLYCYSVLFLWVFLYYMTPFLYYVSVWIAPYRAIHIILFLNWATSMNVSILHYFRMHVIIDIVKISKLPETRSLVT